MENRENKIVKQLRKHFPEYMINTHPFHDSLIKHIDILISNRENQSDQICETIKNIIKYKNEYQYSPNRSCSLCFNNKVHSIEYKQTTLEELILMSPGKAEDHSNFYVCQHFITELDKCNGDFSIVFNFDDYTIKQMISNTNLAFNLSTILKDCYYDRLCNIYLIEPPFFLSPMLKMMETFFSDTIYNKMVIC